MTEYEQLAASYEDYAHRQIGALRATDPNRVDASYTDLLENGDEPELVAIRHGISLDELRGACARSPEGHEMEGHDASAGVWYRDYGRWCSVCGAPDEGADDEG